jgi:hypothetical protein
MRKRTDDKHKSGPEQRSREANDRQRSQRKSDQRLGTVTGEGLGSSSQVGTRLGRDGDVLVPHGVDSEQSESGVRFKSPNPTAAPDQQQDVEDDRGDSETPTRRD